MRVPPHSLVERPGPGSTRPGIKINRRFCYAENASFFSLCRAPRSLADPKHSVPEADRQLYAAAYAQPGGMRAGFEYFRAFEHDAQDFAQLATTRLAMPMLVLTGEKASGEFLIEQAKVVASDVRGIVVKGSGHWLMDEAPATVMPAIIDFVN